MIGEKLKKIVNCYAIMSYFQIFNILLYENVSIGNRSAFALVSESGNTTRTWELRIRIKLKMQC